MAYHQPTTYLEKELMFKNKAENKHFALGSCKLTLAAPRQVSLDVTEGGVIQYNYIESVTVGQYDNILSVTSQKGVSFFLFENRNDRDEWYSTIKQLQRGHVPIFSKKRESLPARPDTSQKPRERQKMPTSSPSTLQEIFKRDLENEISRNLKQPQLKKGSGSYVNMDYNKALQDSKQSYNMFNALHGMQNDQVNPAQSGASSVTEELEVYDMPDVSSNDLVEEWIYEDIDDDFIDPVEDQIYDDAFEEQVYDDTEVGAGATARVQRGAPAAGASQWDSGQTTRPPPLPPRPSSLSSPENVGESADVNEFVADDQPPPIPARPHLATKNDPIQMTRGTRNGKVALRPPNKQLNSKPSQPSTTNTGKPSEPNTDRPKTHHTLSDHSLADELAMKLSQRERSKSIPGRNVSLLPSSSLQDSGNALPRFSGRPNAHVKSMGKSSEVDKVQLRSYDKQNPQPGPTSGLSVTDELAMKLAKRSSSLSSESRGSGLDGQTSHGVTCNSHGISAPSVEHQGKPTSPSWKQTQDRENKPSKSPLLPKKKAVVPPPTPIKPGKSQPTTRLDQDNKKSKGPPPKPAKKPVHRPSSTEIYEDTEVGPPPVKPKPKNIKQGTDLGGVELNVRIPLQAIQGLAGSVTFSDESDYVMIEGTELPDYLHVGDRVLQIGDIDVRNSSAMFVTECWKRVSENQVRVRILR